MFKRLSYMTSVYCVIEPP